MPMGELISIDHFLSLVGNVKMTLYWLQNLESHQVVIDCRDFANSLQIIPLYDGDAGGFLIHITYHIIVGIKVGAIQGRSSHCDETSSTLGCKHSIIGDAGKVFVSYD